MKNLQIFDAHCDTMLKIAEEMPFNFSFDYAVSCGGYLQFFACFTEDTQDFPYENAVFTIKKFLSYIKNIPDVTVVHSPSQAKNILKKGGLAAVLSLENCRCLNENPNNLYNFYKLGVRCIGLTWNGKNAFACGCEEKGGLTAKGEELILLAEKLGVLIDVSHLNNQSLEDVLHFGHGKIFASHSSARSVYDCPRNLTDRQILNIYHSGGIVCACPNPPFLNGYPSADIRDFALHLRHISLLTEGVGIAFGSDTDGTATCCTGLECTNKFSVFFKGLKHLDFTNNEIFNISSCNFGRFLGVLQQKMKF